MSDRHALLLANGRDRRGSIVALAALTVVAAVVSIEPGLGRCFVQTLAGPHVAYAAEAATPRAVGLTFSENPTDDEFLRTGLFAQPLIPVGRTTSAENRDLAGALVEYRSSSRRGDRDAVQPLLGFLESHPTSAWKPALEVDLGETYRQTGHFSKALATWQAAWEHTKALSDPNGRTLGDTAVGYLSQFEAYLGRKELLEPLLNEVKDRPIHGSADQLVAESRRGLADMIHAPEMSFKCGPSALGRILELVPSPTSAKSWRVLELAHSTPKGLSLSAVQAISAHAGMDYQMAFRAVGAPVIRPAVVHWKVGHYAALLGRDSSGRYVVGDPTFGEDIRISDSTLDEEASGYFLVPAGDLPAGWRKVDKTEGEGIWGRGNTGNHHDIGATGAQEPHAFSCGAGGGCSTWNVEAMVVGLSLHDDPIGYTPPVGPPIRFPMDYSHRDRVQPQAFAYTNFGRKWTTGWLSYVRDQAGCDGFYGAYQLATVNGQVIVSPSTTECVELYRRGGGTEPYIFDTGDATNGPPGEQLIPSGLGQFSQGVLTRVVDAASSATKRFYRTLPDGSVEKFDLQAGDDHFFMTEVDDPQGNAVHIQYDSQLRIVALIDAIGQKTKICYNDSWQTTPGCDQPPASTNPTTNLQVTQVTDPFGRSAYFGYDPAPPDAGGTGHLLSITDVLGITSTFHYQAGSDFIDSLTTPYSLTTSSGTTQFQFTDSTDNDPTRSVTIIDPLNRTSRVEFHQGDASTCSTNGVWGDASEVDASLIPCTEKAAPIGASPYTFSNYNLEYRNTFVWDPYEYDRAFGRLAVGGIPSPYAYATIIHWLHANDTNARTASRVPESIRRPLEHRIWFAYENQQINEMSTHSGINYAAEGVGSTNQPTSVGRVLDDGSTQLWQFAYNGDGRVAQMTDPVGRQLTLTYDANGLDLLTVVNTTPGNPAHDDLLVTYSDYNAQHEPQSVTATNGQVWRLTYNAAGQLTSSTDPLGDTWTYAYDGGYLATITGPAAPQVPSYTFGYDGFGRLLTSTDPINGTLTYRYDSANRPTQVAFPDRTSVLFGYTLLDLTSVTDRRGNQVLRHYDADRELYQVDELQGTDTASARSTVFDRYLNGQISGIHDPLNDVTTIRRDLEGRAIEVIQADRSRTEYTYDGSGRITEVTWPGSATSTRLIRYTYNLDDTLSEIEPLFSNPIGPQPVFPTFFTYDPAYRRLTQWSQASARSTGANSPVTTSFEIFSYYPVTSPPSLGANRLWEDITATSDAANGALGLNVITGSRLSYDELDRTNGRELSPAQDVADPTQRTSIAETWGYDALGRLVADDNALDQFAYAYSDATARVQSRRSEAGVQVALNYYAPQDADGLLHQISYYALDRPGAGWLAQYTYGDASNGGYDANHNVAEFTEVNPEGVASSTAYAYDAYNELLLAEPSGLGVADSYQYDPNGNLTSRASALSVFGIILPISLTQSTYGASNEIATTQTTRGLFSSGGGSSVGTGTYDAAGNLLSIGGPTYVYDAMNRLTGVIDGNKTSSFSYDGVGRLVQIVDRVGGQIVANHSYAWCGGARCLRYDNTVLDRQQVPALDKLYVSQGEVQYGRSAILGPTVGREYYVTDGLGTVRAVVAGDFFGTSVTAEYAYDPYGNRTRVYGQDGDDGPGFAGYFHHEASGLDFALGRAYSASLGRWLNRDPIGNGAALGMGPGFDATELNLYAYADGNPTSLRDPSGYCPECLTAAGGAVVGGIGYGLYYAFTAPTSLTWGQFLSGAANAIGQGAYLGGLAGLGASVAATSPLVSGGLLGLGGATLNGDDAPEVNCVAEGLPAATNAGKTVLGHFPEYLRLAENEGANVFNIPSGTWNALSEGERWAANQAFLDQAVARGDQILLATPPNLARAGSYFARELEYLAGKGYVPNADGTALIPGGQ